MTTGTPAVRETARYKTYLNKSEKHVLVLRFPDRDRTHPLSNAFNSRPTAIRMKPKSRLIEIDIPLPDKNHIDQRRAIELGQACELHELSTLKAPVGIAGGFGQALPSRSKDVPHEQPDALLRDFEDAMERKKAFHTVTFSGQIKPLSSTDPSYYLGSFKKDELHLTKVSAFCTLSAGLQHLDMLDVNEKAARRSETVSETQAKANPVQLQYKSTDERVTEEGAWKSLLTDVLKEDWETLDWVDEGVNESFDIFSDTLFTDEASKSNRILAVMSERQYLDTISAPRIDPVEQGRRIKGDGTLADGGEMDTTDASDQEFEDQVMTDVRG